MATPTKNAVILGAGLSGLATAHKLLKHTAPKVKELKVILVAPTTHFYWNGAVVRGLIPGEIPDDKLFAPFQPGFEKYPKEQFEFVLGSATAFDAAQNSVQVETKQGPRTITYDQLIIATGSSAGSDLPIKTLGSYEETVSKLHALQEQIGSAKSIVVAGAGPSGVETVSELGFKYGKDKTITFVIDGDLPLPKLIPAARKAAEKELLKLNVTIINNARVVEHREGNVHLSTGKQVPADLYLPLFGVRPNTSFIPATYLDDTQSLKLDKTLRVAGLTNVWGVGDAGNVQSKQFSAAEPQVNHLFGNLDAVFTGAEKSSFKEYTPGWNMMFVTLGKKAGTGDVNGYKVFSWIVAMTKSKNMFLEKVPDIVAGKVIIQTKI